MVVGTISLGHYPGKRQLVVRLLLEADRERLYKRMPVPDGWHKGYETGKVTTDDYQNMYQ